MIEPEDEDPEEPSGKHAIYRGGKVHLLSEMCETCIFNPRTRPVSGARVAGMVRETMDEEGSTVVCHSTLYNTDGKEDQEHAICRGWYDRLAGRDNVLRLAAAMDIIQEVPPPTK